MAHSPTPVDYDLVETTAAKAWIGALLTFLTVLAAVFTDNVFNTSEVASVVAGLVGFIVTVTGIYYTKNKVKR